jgi:hypothetical protein
MMRVYISGPMAGIPGMNLQAFSAAAAELRALGLEVVNPAELNPEPWKPWRECMAVDIKALVDCDAILMLPGFAKSRGANLELDIAESLGMAVFHGVEALQRWLEERKPGAAA